MFRSLTVLGLCAVALAATSTTSFAAPKCAKRTKIVKILGDRYGEHQQVLGLASDSNILELFASKKGTWTALLSFPDGLSCIVSVGDAWTTIPVKSTGPEV